MPADGNDGISHADDVKLYKQQYLNPFTADPVKALQFVILV